MFDQGGTTSLLNHFLSVDGATREGRWGSVLFPLPPRAGATSQGAEIRFPVTRRPVQTCGFSETNARGRRGHSPQHVEQTGNLTDTLYLVFAMSHAARRHIFCE